LGLVDGLKNLRVCIDTAPFIYFIEKHPKYLDVIKPIFIGINTGEIKAITSPITLQSANFPYAEVRIWR